MLLNYDIVDSNDQDFVNLMEILLNADSLTVDIFYLVDDEIEDLKIIAAYLFLFKKYCRYFCSYYYNFMFN